MARPKKQRQEKRSEQTKERWTLAEYAYLNQQARIAGVTRAEFVRRRALSRPVSAAPTSSSYDPAIISELNRIGVNLNQIAKHANAGRGAPHSLVALQADLQRALEKVLHDGS